MNVKINFDYFGLPAALYHHCENLRVDHVVRVSGFILFLPYCNVVYEEGL